MSETKWTRGNWRTVSGGYRIVSSGGEDGSVQIAIVGGCRDDEDMAHCHERWNADAHLIAAAPDMYEALERLVSDVERGVHVEFGGTPWVKGKLAEIGYARAALSKARGEQ